MSSIEYQPSSSPKIGFLRYVSGVTLVAIVAAAAFGLRQVPGMSNFSPMITAIFLGMLFANFVAVPLNAMPGVKLMGKGMLRLAVALLGFQLTLAQVFAVGLSGMLVLAAIVASTYFFTLLGARLLGVDMSLARLIGAGTAICGASAVAAADSIRSGPDEDVAYAIGCVTLFGTISMLLYPVTGASLRLEPGQFGFWAGSSIHEVAQVVATGFQYGAEAGETSVVVKLSRVLLLAPLLIGMAALSKGGSGQSAKSLSFTQIFPVFVIAFIAAMLASSLDIVPDGIHTLLVQVTPILLTASLGALGLCTTFQSIRARGLRPLVLAGSATLFIAVVGLLSSQALG
ncbi:putative sulfate exporter family transporter [Mesorhizobium sp. RP14(2022)]|uniref:Sulfate exporter family transporter n=1 Tax=Mesorhizobium liriopis TaxID=2953882 RepID=A0ABT1C3E1_9HYPH|nr:putative sulfate exporter family transporter [Mesorhizobium liriopis]MCO6049353.1 putative sulfate exporter family transporter [Mesorhizobium liriopis]